MTNIEYIFKQLGYGDITSKFIELPNISQIHLSTNGSLFREPNGVSKYYLDTTNNLLYKTTYNINGKELGISAIIAADEIVSISTRNAYSASMFVGNDY